MPRKKSEADLLDDATISIVPGRKSKPTRGKLLDPQAPLPGALKRVGPLAEKEDTKQQKLVIKADQKILRAKFDQYCRELTKSYGDPVPALAIVFDISEDEARERQVELHDEITRAVNSLSTKDLLDMSGLSKPYRIMKLKLAMNSDNPAAMLKAIDMLNDMDGASKTSGETWEEWIASALHGR